MFVAALLIVGVVVTPLVNSIDYTPEVTIDSGKLRGLVVLVPNTNYVKVRKYLGIPFAKAERFQPPKQPSPWPESEVKDMITFGKVCPQAFLTVSQVKDMSEDCLNLNLFVPNDNNSSPLPVMVWIHGGAFFGGSNRQYDSSYLAVLGKVVVVVINYRLSVFGFLTNGKHGDIKGNYGMLDQIEALKWVKRNIKAFNGDPNKVTIFGESAGGASVSLLMLSKLAKGLFHRAIPQSGDAAAPWSTATYDVLAHKMKVFAKNAGCPEDLVKIKDCLKSKKMMDIVKASLRTPFPSFIPVIDGNFLEDAPSVLYKKQQIEKIDVMMGVTNDEGVVFTKAIPGLNVGIGANVTNGLTREGFVKAVKEPGFVASLIIPNTKSVLLDATVYRYTDWTNVTNIYRNRRMYVDLLSDSSFIAPAILAAQAYSNKTAKTYFYHLEYRYDKPLFGLNIPSWVKANHGADIFFVFGAMLSKEKATVSANFSREVIKLWTNFAKTGNPNSPASIGVSWPQYTPDQQKYLSLKPDMEVNSHLRADYTAYWNNFIPDALRSTPPCKCMPCGGSADIKTTGFVILLLSIGITWLF